ncbi:MAG: prolyl oligopeptidase family serine peptidase [Pseudomonadota bacterium]
MAKISYPVTSKVDQVDVYHGVTVADPYRWLEDDVRQNDEVRNWVDAQQATTQSYVEALPDRQSIRDELARIWDTQKYGVPSKAGDLYFFSYNDGLANQDQVLVQRAHDEPSVLFDPNTWSEDGTTALAAYYPDPTGRYVAYMIQQDGSDWRTAKIRDLQTGKDLEEALEWLKFTGLSWQADGSGFFYSGYPEPEDDQFHGLPDRNTVYFHELGSPQAADKVVYENLAHPDWRYAAWVSEGGEYLVVLVVTGTDSRYQVLVRPAQSDADLEFLVTGFEHDFTPIGFAQGKLYFRSDLGAPKGRIISLNPELGDQALERMEEIVPERDSVLQTASLVGGKLVAQYLVDASSRLEAFDLDGSPLGTIVLPGIGTVSDLSGRMDDNEVFFAYSSINYPPTILRLDAQSQQTEVFRQSDYDIDLSDFVIKQAFYASKDGTQIPMFISHHKNIQLDGSNPTLLYGYGGFNISLTPGFSITRAVWMLRGGVVAVANLRGGGEYGEAWHDAGTKLKKQNVFDDFIAAGEYLIEQNYTNSDHLAIMGGSNGGLLVGAVLNQRPELFAAALPAVGVMDMLRFHKFTAGVFWIDDYGSADNEDEFLAIYKYSPYHNIAQIEYPPVLVATADTDDRVVPGHSFKYAARLQEYQQGSAPVLLRVETDAGHGAGTPTDKLIDEYADYWAFLLHHTR